MSMKATVPDGAARDMPALTAGDLVDEREAAAILNVSLSVLRNWRWKKAGPRYRKLGRRMVRYHVADLAAFAEGGAQ